MPHKLLKPLSVAVSIVCALILLASPTAFAEKTALVGGTLLDGAEVVGVEPKRNGTLGEGRTGHG